MLVPTNDNPQGIEAFALVWDEGRVFLPRELSQQLESAVRPPTDRRKTDLRQLPLWPWGRNTQSEEAGPKVLLSVTVNLRRTHVHGDETHSEKHIRNTVFHEINLFYIVVFPSDTVVAYFSMLSLLLLCFTYKTRQLLTAAVFLISCHSTQGARNDLSLTKHWRRRWRRRRHDLSWEWIGAHPAWPCKLVRQPNVLYCTTSYLTENRCIRLT